MRRSLRALSLWLSLSLAGAVCADPLQGVYEIEVGGVNEIWIATGGEQACIYRNLDQICVTTTGVATDGRGEVTSTGTIAFHFPGVIDMELPMLLRGRLGGAAIKPKPKVAVTATGTATLHDPVLPDIEAAASAIGKLTCANPLPHDSTFACSGRLKVCLAFLDGRSCATGRIEAALGALGGPWTLALDVATDGAGIVTGSATATLPNAALETFAVTGKYVAGKDQSKLKLESSDPQSKNKLSLVRRPFEGGPTIEQRLKFKVAGESGSQQSLIVP
jgi:hypothetical protein